MSKHTPGPWTVSPSQTYKAQIEHLAGKKTVVFARVTTPKIGDAIANARLIAAAPTMLEALEALDALIDFGDHVPDNTAMCFDDASAINEALAKARAAIALATKETP